MKKITKQLFYNLLLIAMLIGYTIDIKAQCSTTNDPEVTNGAHVADVFTSYQGNADASSQVHYALTIAQSFTANCDGTFK